MKTIKNGLLVLALLSIAAICNANDNENVCAKKGDSFFDFTVGGPGLADYTSDYQLYTLPVSCKYEFLFTENVGIGFQFNYREVKKFTENDTYFYDRKKHVNNFMFNLNFHLMKADNYDSYLLLGGGYGLETFTTRTNDENYTHKRYEHEIPVATRVAIGGRYFFSKVVALNVEFGFGGGPLLLGGLSVKI